MKPPATFQEFISNFPVRRYRKGAIVLYQGEVSQNAFVLRRGTVKVYGINSQGDERIIAFFRQDDIFPSAWTPSESLVAPYYFEALEDIMTYVIPQSELKKLTHSSSECQTYITDYYIKHYTDLMMRISALEQARATDKVMHTLFYLVHAYGETINENEYKITIALTQQMIASLIGLTRETTANELLALKKKGILKYTAKQYIINRKKLLALLGEETFYTL